MINEECLLPIIGQDEVEQEPSSENLEQHSGNTDAEILAGCHEIGLQRPLGKGPGELIGKDYGLSLIHI